MYFFIGKVILYQIPGTWRYISILKKWCTGKVGSIYKNIIAAVYFIGNPGFSGIIIKALLCRFSVGIIGKQTHFYISGTEKLGIRMFAGNKEINFIELHNRLNPGSRFFNCDIIVIPKLISNT